jgi:membrane protein DedA with SNARE-associated domain
MDILQTLLDLFAEYGYWVVFFGVMLENAGLPVPGETILLAAGFASALGVFHLPLVMLIAAAGAVIGDNVGYWVGHHYGRAVFEKFGRFVFLTPARLARMDAFFAKHGSKTIFVARFITGLRVFAALFAGATRMPWRTFFLYNVSGAVVRDRQRRAYLWRQLAHTREMDRPQRGDTPCVSRRRTRHRLAGQGPSRLSRGEP